MPLISWRPADNAVMLSERTAHCSLDVFVKFLSVCEPQGENMKGLRACYTRICGYAERVRGARAGASLEGEAGVTAM